MLRRRPIVLLGLIVGIVMTSSAPVSAAALFAPGGFRLQASNGYSIHVIVFDGDPRGEHDEVVLSVGRRGSGATYFVERGVQVTETTVSADLGKLGSIDLRFVPSGKPRIERSACGSQPIEFDSGSYEGRIDFEGEEGYTEAHRSRARGEIRFLVSLLCGGEVDEGIGGHSPGARLQMRRHWNSGSLEFEATKNSPTRRSRFRASIVERRDGMVVAREVKAAAGPGAFAFNVPSQEALLEPPSPFNGSARFKRDGKGPGRLQRRLVVDFPGRSGVSLSGARGSLRRWVDNPSHPFRPAARLLPKRS